MEPPSPQILYTQNGFFWNSELEEFVEMYWDTVFDYVRAGGGKPTWAAFNPQKMIQLGRHGSYDEMFDDLQAIVGEDVAPVGSANGNNLDLFLSESGILMASAETWRFVGTIFFIGNTPFLSWSAALNRGLSRSRDDKSH